MNKTDYIELEYCKKGFFYQVAARNFRYAIFDGHSGFIGVRHKFKNTFLFKELHWDADSSFGTVKPIKKLSFLDNENIRLTEYLGSMCKYCGTNVSYQESGLGWIHQLETDCQKPSPMTIINYPLREALDNFLEKVKEDNGSMEAT